MRLPRLPPLGSLGQGPTRALVRGLAVAAVVLGAWLWLGDDEPAPADEAGSDQRRVEAEAEAEPRVVVVPAPVLASPTAAALPPDCDALAARASEGGPDAVLLAWLCPEHALDPVAARAALLAVRSPDEAAALAARLHGHAALQGLLRLVAQAPAGSVDALPDPAHAIVSPIDDRVLAELQRAHATIAARGIPPVQRTRARALVAKAYLQATQQLGVAVGRPPEPFARLLAGRALHHGRQFCLAYLQGRVGGLAPLFHELESHLLALVVALEGSPHHGDAARLAVELEEARRYLQRSGPQSRMAQRAAAQSRAPGAPQELRPLADALARLLDHGFVDLALATAIEAGLQPEGTGLQPMEQHLRDAMAHAERGEYVTLLEHRLARARARTPPPPEHGTAPPLRIGEPPWPSASTVADEAAAWIERAPAEPELPRRYALGRALLLVRSRPDALVLLLDHATAEDASPALREAVAWLRRELEARDDGRLPWLQRRVAAEPDPIRAYRGNGPGTAADQARVEAARRRQYAVRMREADRQPRGAGIGDGAG
jgi:hypothetical protein